MNVTFCLVQSLIQYHQLSEQEWTKVNYKKKLKKHLRIMIRSQQALVVKQDFSINTE